MEKIKQVVEKVFKKSFWLTKENIKNIKVAANQSQISESALMRHIISNWFKK